MICLIIFLSSVLLVSMCAQQKATARSPLLRIFFNYSKIDEFKLFLSEKLENINNEHNPDAIGDIIIEVYKEGINKYS